MGQLCLNERENKEIKLILKVNREEDLETIENLKDDIKQLLKEYKLIEKQKDNLDSKYKETWRRNDELIREILNMEQVIEDQDNQISNLKEKFHFQMKEITHNHIIKRHIDMMKDNLNPALDWTETDLNISSNISQQITLENFKAGKIGPRDSMLKKKVNHKALKKALNLSFQIINPEGDRLEQSIIEEKIALRKARGISPFGIVQRSQRSKILYKEGNKRFESEIENELDVGKIKYWMFKRLHSTGTIWLNILL